ncbi:SMI1/KNR4 family protein [Streptomyces liangshanensis]|uniref:SMI1/KNR4 family protein n=1 Tax=Streptomyces liangshanensis TaxID=2717324 RepID=A0A6G9H3Q5_9ACTN|nr:SMI1/KNR4 family protein [Streptomyces liangshanensis]QIQ05110.1 SMI1/KNR4 family protein [Streptomyces liangshanensis]
MKIYNWRPFLDRWSADWIDSPHAEGREDAAEEVVRDRWLGFAPAGAERISGLEERLGTELPPSFRSFLAVTDGWRPAGTAVELLGTVDGVHWHKGAELQELYESGLDEGASDGEVLRAGMWGRALQLSVASDLTDLLLDPGDVNADGEWAAYLYRSWSGEPPVRYESFLDLMQALFRDFHRSSAVPEFVNATTRELDAAVEEARVACLAGEDIDGQLDVFEDAVEHGRPRAGGFRTELAALLDGRPGDAGARLLPYEPDGPFRVAVDTAREQARWGDTDAAWRTLATAVGTWEPHGNEHVAPVGLLADPVLGPVITPERGRYLLETPRGGGRRAGGGEGLGEAGEGWDAPGLVSREVGLTWLADHVAQPGDYRFVLVRGVSPREVAARVGEGVLLPPGDEGEFQRRSFGPDARPMVRVGTAGEGWSFAFGTVLEPFRSGQLADPGERASRGTEAVTVWVERGDTAAARPGAFYFSYAEDGRRVYGFAVRGDEIEEWGDVPEALDPEELFPGAEVPEDVEEEYVEHEEYAGPAPVALDVDDEFEALDALTDFFGVALPQLALRRGRLHAVAAGPWIAAR